MTQSRAAQPSKPDPSQFNTDRTYPGRWTITFSNPPINMFVPTTIFELDALMTELDADPSEQRKARKVRGVGSTRSRAQANPGPRTDQAGAGVGVRSARHGTDPARRLNARRLRTTFRGPPAPGW